MNAAAGGAKAADPEAFEPLRRKALYNVWRSLDMSSEKPSNDEPFLAAGGELDSASNQMPSNGAESDQVLPGISKDPEQRKLDYAVAEELERRRDAVGSEIAQISKKLAEARKRGDKELVKSLLEKQGRLDDLRESLR